MGRRDASAQAGMGRGGGGAAAGACRDAAVNAPPSPCSREMQRRGKAPAALFARALSGMLLRLLTLVGGNLQCLGVMFNIF